MTSPPASRPDRYNRFLLLVAGLGGLLYGIDVGIIAGALPYLEATSGLDAGRLSIIVAAVLLGSVISTLVAGLLSDVFGRRPMMFVSGLVFVASIPMIALAQGFGPLVIGRLLQGISAGLIGVVVPLYLAECLGAGNRGKGTGIFQWMLTLGIVAAAVIGYGFSLWIGGIEKTGTVEELFAAKDHAWRWIFWVSLAPGLLFTAGSLRVTESPRWLHRRGRHEAARAALLRSRGAAAAEAELQQMDAAAGKTRDAAQRADGPLFSRRYVLPFLLACIILACNQATGVNSIIGYNATILLQAGLNDAQAHMGYVVLTLVNFLMTLGAVALVDRKGRKFLLTLGSGGIIFSLVAVGFLFRQTESKRVDVAPAVAARIVADAGDETLRVDYDAAVADALLQQAGHPAAGGGATTLSVIYSTGDFTSAASVVRSDDRMARVDISRNASLPSTAVEGFFISPFADLAASRTAGLRIEHAFITPVPATGNGIAIAACLLVFMGFFAIGPGVCVWLALSELMPTRIRSNGMSIALLVNQAVSTGIAAAFLPAVGRYGYSTMFFIFAGCTVIYFITAAFFLPETKGRTLEEIEASFNGGKN